MSSKNKLNNLNHKFYESIHDFFSNSRNYMWSGWDKINFEKINSSTKKHIRVLDLACGNARFALLLQKKLQHKTIHYTGIDFSESLLQKAKETLKTTSTEHDLLELDLLNSSFYKKFEPFTFDIIAIMGFMHHIPSRKQRIVFLQNTQKLLNKDGFIIITFWQFKNHPRLKNKIIDPKTSKSKEILSYLNIEAEELKKDDFILSWNRGKTSYRYCHHYTREEIKSLLDLSKLRLDYEFFSDSKEQNGNLYTILKHK